MEAAFDAATQYVGSASSSGALSDAQLLQFYGLYKQATVGACATPKPSFFDRKGRAKWQAWADRAGLGAAEAQQQYVALLTQLIPGWAGSGGGGGGGGEQQPRRGGAGGPVQSRMAVEEEDAAAEDAAPPLLQAARAGDAAAVQRLLQQPGADVDQRGSEGEAALHWAADRGHLLVLSLLLAQNADVNASDGDGLTPLHYAALAEQQAAAELLAAAPGADLSARSAEGETAADVAPAGWHFLRGDAS